MIKFSYQCSLCVIHKLSKRNVGAAHETENRTLSPWINQQLLFFAGLLREFIHQRVSFHSTK